MKVIFLKHVPKAGRQFEVKDVADGYAQNFLFPRGLAEPALASRVRALENKRAEIDAKSSADMAQVIAALEKLDGASVEILGPANEQGHLFKGIHKEEILAALKEQKGIVLPEESLLLEHPLKETGVHELAVEVGEHKSVLKVSVGAE